MDGLLAFKVIWTTMAGALVCLILTGQRFDCSVSEFPHSKPEIDYTCLNHGYLARTSPLNPNVGSLYRYYAEVAYIPFISALLTVIAAFLNVAVERKYI